MKHLFCGIILSIILLFSSSSSYAGEKETHKKDSLLLLASDAVSRDEFEQACLFYRQAIVLNDTITKLNYEKEVKALKSEYQIDELYLENKKQENKILIRLIIFGSVLILLSLTSYFLLKRRNSRFIKEKEELEKQKKKDEALLMESNGSFYRLIRELNVPLRAIDCSDNIDTVKENLSRIKKLVLSLLLFVGFSFSAISQQINPEIQAASDSVLYYYRKMEIDGARRSLDKLKILSEKYQYYDMYFKSWKNLLILESSKGNIEQVIIESVKMRKEADSLNNHSGVVNAAISLANAYYFSRNNEKVIEILDNLLSSEDIEDKDLIGIYQKLHNCYYNIEKKRESIRFLKLEEETIQRVIKEEPEKASSINGMLLSLYIRYADTYFFLNEPEKSYKYLVKAKNYYTDNCFISNYILYHQSWSRYYSIIKEWDKCFSEIDMAIDKVGDSQPLFKSFLLRQKASYIEFSGNPQMACIAMKKCVEYDDSLNSDFLSRQDKIIKDNFRWKSAQIKNVKNNNIINIITISFISLFFAIILILILRILYLNYILKKVRNSVRDAADKVAVSAQLRDRYIKNVRREISIPFQEIEKLCNDPSSDINTVKKYSSSIIFLLDKVLDLSFIETGQMQYDVREYDILTLCYDLIDAANSRQDTRMEITFESSVDSQMIKMDYNKFMEYLSFVFILPEDYKLSEKIEFSLSYSELGDAVVLSFFATPLTNLKFEGCGQSVQNNLNKLFFDHFGGTYDAKMSKLRPELVITLKI